MKDDVLKSAEALIEAMDAAQGRTSAVFNWLYKNHDELLARLSVRRANWMALSQRLGEWQIFNGCGEPPTAECVRQTWIRVRKTIKRHRGQPGQKSETPSSAYRPCAAIVARPDRELPVVEDKPPKPIITKQSYAEASGRADGDGTGQLDRLFNSLPEDEE
jgi:hypothetical protein